jgi:hypothetical protein
VIGVLPIYPVNRNAPVAVYVRTGLALAINPLAFPARAATEHVTRVGTFATAFTTTLVFVVVATREPQRTRYEVGFAKWPFTTLGATQVT